MKHVWWAVLLLAATIIGLPLQAQQPQPQSPPQPATGQRPPQPAPRNLQYFPKDTTREALIPRMREFAMALGVRCQYCHEGGDGQSLEGVIFESDDKAAKRKARAMLHMVDDINTKLLAVIPDRSVPPVQVQCVTCHRGSPIPRTLDTVLTETIQSDGVEAAIAKYRQLRTDTLVLGRFNFGEPTLSEVARRMNQAGKPAAALDMLKLNQEFYPKSADIDVQLAETHLAMGNKEAAISALKTALEKQPDNPRAKRRLEELTKER
jgi:hypothetical protein